TNNRLRGKSKAQTRPALPPGYFYFTLPWQVRVGSSMDFNDVVAFSHPHDRISPHPSGALWEVAAVFPILSGGEQGPRTEGPMTYEPGQRTVVSAALCRAHWRQQLWQRH